MSIGFAMLVHDAFDRAAAVARYWAERGCPVVIHVDRRVPDARVERFRTALGDLDQVLFCERFRCTWGTWSLVAAAQAASEMLLDRFPAISHVYLASGSCLPLRPVSELIAYLDDHPDTDFIESVTIADVPWTQGGLDTERFTLAFPVGWKEHRALFDTLVRLQRRLGMRRRLPAGLVPHLGSQWWCLTRRTLSDILTGPDRARFDAFFRRVWIPDESYFQTMVRQYGRRIESRSLTLSKFDFQGKPHIFFDDHLQLLRRSDCFVARKIWPGADTLYDTFLSDAVMIEGRREPQPGRIDRVFSKAVQRRVRGRPGLRMAGRYPDPGRSPERTAAPYAVFCGLDDVFEAFPDWVAGVTGMTGHGRLFAPDRVAFAEGQTTFAGALCDSPALRDYDPAAFLRNLVWNTRGERQCLQFGPTDRQEITGTLVGDANARITVITGAWSLSLFRAQPDPAAARHRAAELQHIEAAFLARLRATDTRAFVRIVSLSELLEQPMEVLQAIIAENGPNRGAMVTEVPRMADLTGFDRFLQGLKNQGMNPYLVGDFHAVFAQNDGDDTAGGAPVLVT